jgi:hypothetical protein
MPPPALPSSASSPPDWFDWAQQQPPRGWRRWLIVGAVAGLLTAIAGGIVAWQNWDTGTVFDAATGRSFGIVVGIEVLLAGPGAWFLASRKRNELIPPWVAVVVGVHFFPLAPLFNDPMFYVLAVTVTIGALASVPLARSRSLAVSAVTGVVTGSLLLAAALFSLLGV